MAKKTNASRKPARSGKTAGSTSTKAAAPKAKPKAPAKPAKAAAPTPKPKAAASRQPKTTAPTRAAGTGAKRRSPQAAAPAKEPAAKPKLNGRAAPLPSSSLATTKGRPVPAPAEPRDPRPTPPAPAPPLDANDDAGHKDPFAHLPLEQLRKVKTGLSKKDLDHFLALLLEKRGEILGDVQTMNDGARNQNSGGNLSHMPVHMADIGSDHYEQEFTLGLVESEAKLLREVNEAILRIRDGTYGVCLVSGQPIPRSRLEVKPWAKYTIEVVRDLERAGRM